MKQTKKGFTIVELVIVIAVLAILISVLIPTFSTLINKSNLTKDAQMCRILNEELSMAVAQPGYKTPSTYADVLEFLSDKHTVENLTPTSTGDIVWDANTNTFSLIDNGEFVYVGDNKTKTNYKANDLNINLWTIVSDIPAMDKQNYSMLLKQDAVLTNHDIRVGFDVGNNISVTELNYNRADATVGQEVIIRTNGGTLTVNAPKDTVKHYNAVNKVIINHINTSSYHEFGRVEVSMEIKDGHAVVEADGYVNELAIPETAVGDVVSVSVETRGVVNTAVIDNTSATVEIASGAEVAQVVANETAKENISGAGATEVKANAVEKTLVYNESGENQITLKEAIEARKDYIVLAEDITCGSFSSTDSTVAVSITYSVIIDGNGHSLTGTKAVTRGIWVDSDNVTLTIKNLTIGGAKLERAVQVNGGFSNVNIVLDNVNATASYYTVNVCSNTTKIGLKIMNSTLVGWGAVNVWGRNYTVNISDSTLIGNNNKSYNKDGWNDFGTIILEGDTTGTTTEHASDIDVVLLNSVVTATTSGQGNQQWCILFNNPSAHNNVFANGCTFNYNHNEKTKLLLGTNETNHFYNNGVEVLDD